MSLLLPFPGVLTPRTASIPTFRKAGASPIRASEAFRGPFAQDFDLAVFSPVISEMRRVAGLNFVTSPRMTEKVLTCSELRINKFLSSF